MVNFLDGGTNVDFGAKLNHGPGHKCSAMQPESPARASRGWGKLQD
ncbi:MAG: hypothetical protein JXR70_07735 [Spirochaetales bacterium]|nr:hypothetical protein [Spirochaetales bacterium]